MLYLVKDMIYKKTYILVLYSHPRFNLKPFWKV